MDKEKQILEMAKLIDDRLLEARNYLGSMNRGEGYWIAQKLIDFYQPKINDNEIVISKEEKQKLLKEMYKQGKFDAIADLEKDGKIVISKEEYERLSIFTLTTARQIMEQERKETAREILQELYSKTEARRKHCIEREQFYKEKGKQALANYWSTKECELSIVKNNVIASAKQYGVEIKE